MHPCLIYAEREATGLIADDYHLNGNHMNLVMIHCASQQFWLPPIVWICEFDMVHNYTEWSSCQWYYRCVCVLTTEVTTRQQDQRLVHRCGNSNRIYAWCTFVCVMNGQLLGHISFCVGNRVEIALQEHQITHKHIRELIFVINEKNKQRKIIAHRWRVDRNSVIWNWMKRNGIRTIYYTLFLCCLSYTQKHTHVSRKWI